MDRFDEMRAKGKKPKGNLSITENGSYDVSDYASVGVAVENESGGGDYNVFVQNSEPASKDGVWIRKSSSTGDVHFLNSQAKEATFDNENLSHLATNNDIVGQVIIGDLLYSFGTSSSTSFVYNLKTKTQIKTLNVPQVSNIRKSDSLYVESENAIFIFYNTTTSENGIYWYKYNIADDTYTSSSFSATRAGLASFLKSVFYEGMVYVACNEYNRPNYSLIIKQIDPTTNTITSYKNTVYSGSGSIASVNNVFRYEYKVYFIWKGSLRILNFNSNTYTNKTIFTATDTNNYMYYANVLAVIDDKVYINYISTICGNNYGVYNLSTEEFTILQSEINLNASSNNENLTQGFVYDEKNGVIYARNKLMQPFAFKLFDMDVSNYEDNTVLIIQNFDETKATKILNSGLKISTKNVFMVENENIKEYLTFWGNGEKWNLLKNPSNETVTVTFNSNGGTEITSQEIVIGQLITIPDPPTKEGFEFEYWSLNGEQFDFSTPITSNIELLANYITI